MRFNHSSHFCKSIKKCLPLILFYLWIHLGENILCFNCTNQKITIYRSPADLTTGQTMPKMYTYVHGVWGGWGSPQTHGALELYLCKGDQMTLKTFHGKGSVIAFLLNEQHNYFFLNRALGKVIHETEWKWIRVLTEYLNTN